MTPLPVRNLFFAITFIAILDAQIQTAATLEAKNPPRFQNNIVQMIQSFA
nr:hypothetical protein [Neobacillus sp. Marseille-Q6967]